MTMIIIIGFIINYILKKTLEGETLKKKYI